MMPETFTSGEAYTAMCLWEAVVDKEDIDIAPWRAFRSQHGTRELRDVVLSLAAACELEWNAMTDEQRDDAGAFDWEFCPKWLSTRVCWSFGIPALRKNTGAPA